MRGKSGRRLPAAAWATTGQFAYEPVRRRRRSRRVAPLRRRTSSTARTLDAAHSIAASRPRRCQRRSDTPFEELLEHAKRLLELERALFDSRLHIACAALGRHRYESVVGESRAARANVVGEPGGARCGADGAETGAGSPVDDADVRETILEGAVELQLAPTADGVYTKSGNLLARRADVIAVQRDVAAADENRPEEEAMAGQPGIEPAGSLGECRELHVAGGEAGPAQTAAMSLRWLHALELEHDRSARASSDRASGQARPRAHAHTQRCSRRHRPRMRALHESFLERVTFGARSRPRCL